MNVKCKFIGFCVILTESRMSNPGRLTNVKFSKLEKKLLKSKVGYTSDVEFEQCNDCTYISRKLVFPLLTPEQLLKLVSDRCLEYNCETMGSLTIEHGWLGAKSYEAEYDYCRKENTNAYISVLFDFEGFENVEKESMAMQRNYKFQEDTQKAIFEAIDDNDLEYFETIPEFCENLDQLELKFLEQ